MFIFDYSIIIYNRDDEIIATTFDSVYARNEEEVKEYVQDKCQAGGSWYEVPGEIHKDEPVAIQL